MAKIHKTLYVACQQARWQVPRPFPSGHEGDGLHDVRPYYRHKKKYSRGKEGQEEKKEKKKTRKKTRKVETRKKTQVLSCFLVHRYRKIGHSVIDTLRMWWLLPLHPQVLYWERGCHKWVLQGSATFLTPHSHSEREPTREPSLANSQSGPSSMDLLSTQCSF